MKQKKKKKIEKRKQNKRVNKGRIIRDIRTLFEQEEDYYEPKRVIFGIIIILNMKAMVIKIGTYHLMNILKLI